MVHRTSSVAVSILTNSTMLLRKIVKDALVKVLLLLGHAHVDSNSDSTKQSHKTRMRKKLKAKLSIISLEESFLIATY